MEPPIALDADSLRDEEVKVLRQVAPMQRGRTVRGQYAGYTAEPGVRAGSNTETFVATELTIDSWRWAGVPFHLRTGKHLPIDATEAVIEFRSPPQTLFRGAGGADAMSKGGEPAAPTAWT
jgi:glucose-6-phosphate 1-dehydrogenase